MTRLSIIRFSVLLVTTSGKTSLPSTVAICAPDACKNKRDTTGGAFKNRHQPDVDFGISGLRFKGVVDLF